MKLVVDWKVFGGITEDTLLVCTGVVWAEVWANPVSCLPVP